MYMKDLDFRGMGNTRISARLKQVIILIVASLIGMIVSAAVNGF